jgi:hypothetical protein
MHADDTTDAAAEATGDSTTLTDLVRQRLERDALRPEAAADAIGIPTARLIALLQGRSPNFSTQRKIEAWLSGVPAAAEPEELASSTGDTEVPQPPSTGSTPAPTEAPVTGEVRAETPATAPKRRGRPPKIRASEPMPTAEATAQLALTASMPKRRGRPPKNPAAADAAPKRRGRPPKNPQADAPKRRGRPPKNPTAATAAPKRRGRPPKSPQAAESPKRRGRPPKNPAAAAPATSLELLPKRRGRPPKNRSPLGAALRELVAIADDALALAVHRADPARRKRVEAALRGG